MIILSDSIEINAPAKKIFGFFMNLRENYRAWHPDHIICRYFPGGPAGEGSTIYVEENLHGKLHKLKMKLTKIKSDSRIEYTALLGTKGVFSVEPKNDQSSIFTAELHFGTKIPVLDFLFDLALKSLFSRQLKALKQHMQEEGINLKKILEKG